MSELSNLIFHNAEHKLSSPYGPRKTISTSAGNTSSFHNGADYSTNSKKLPQFGVADDGEVTKCGKDTSANGYALFVKVKYPSLGVELMHYHLDSISIKVGQKVTTKTEVGKTGKTGKATGIHLHLGIKRLSGGSWIDPEKWSKEELPALLKKIEDEKKKAEQPKFTKGNYRVKTSSTLIVRAGAGKSYTKRTFSQLTENAQKKIKKLAGKEVDGYVKGVEFTASEVKHNKDDGYTWGKTPSGWVALDYCEKIK